MFVAPLLVVLAAFMVIHQRGGTLSQPGGPGAMLAPSSPPQLSGRVRVVAGALAGLTILLGVVSAVQVYRIGDTGARAAWSDKQYVTQSFGPRPGGG